MMDKKEAMLYIIEPKKGWIPIDLKEIFRFRELLYFLAWRDIKLRYKQTVLGAGWAIIQPLFGGIHTIFWQDGKDTLGWHSPPNFLVFRSYPVGVFR